MTYIARARARPSSVDMNMAMNLPAHIYATAVLESPVSAANVVQCVRPQKNGTKRQIAA